MSRNSFRSKLPFPTQNVINDIIHSNRTFIFKSIRYLPSYCSIRKYHLSLKTFKNEIKDASKTKFQEYYMAIALEAKNNEEMQKLQRDKALKSNEDPRMAERAMRKWMFLEAVEVFLENNGEHKRGHVEFIFDALKHMEPLGLHRDISCYKALFKVNLLNIYIHYILSLCELVYKPEARVELKAGRSIKIVCKVARPVDSNFEVKF